MANVLDCDMVVSEFEPQSPYYVHFRINTLGKSIIPFNQTTAMGQIIPLLFYNISFGFK